MIEEALIQWGAVAPEEEEEEEEEEELFVNYIIDYVPESMGQSHTSNQMLVLVNNICALSIKFTIT